MNAVHCPSCERVLYNRRASQCGYCGAHIPEELRFTADEEAELDRQLAELKALRDKREAECDQRIKEQRETNVTFFDLLN
tara:strand:+ start:2186 stop:2425 length:240 start_codon:yes stop_codon:yes gene_type:complete